MEELATTRINLRIFLLRKKDPLNLIKKLRKKLMKMSICSKKFLQNKMTKTKGNKNPLKKMIKVKRELRKVKAKPKKMKINRRRNPKKKSRKNK